MKRIRRFSLRLIVSLCLMCIPCIGLADVLVIPAGVSTIEEEAFFGTAAKTLVIPDTTTRIESNAFVSCSALTDVYLPENAISIADDAFDNPSSLTFHVYMGSANANWARDHSFSIEYMTADDMDYGGWRKVESLVQTELTDSSQSDQYGTHRLIICLNPGYSMPDLNSFRYQEGGNLEDEPIIVPIETDHYIVQFHTSVSARNCAETIKAWEGCRYVEADYFMSGSSVAKSERYTRKSGSLADADDPMGFSAYTKYLGNNVGNVTIAVIGTGVNKDQVNCKVSPYSYDCVYSRLNAVSGFADLHETQVTQKICEAFGDLAKNHLTVISYRVTNPTNPLSAYSLTARAIKRAKDDGADFINISHGFESSYSQDNFYMQEAIAYFDGTIFAAAGNNSALSVQNALPAKFCIEYANVRSVTGARKGVGGVLTRAATASGANYAGFDDTSSFATAKVTAAAALLYLDSNPDHTLNGACEFITEECGLGMPVLTNYVYTLVKNIVLNGGNTPSSYALEVGAPLYIQYAANPSNATDPTILAESSDPTVLKMISDNGTHYRFDAVGKGQIEITFTSRDGNATPIVIPVTVRQPVTRIEVTGTNEKPLMKGQTLKLTANVYPEDPTDNTIIWTSSNDLIASVSQEGVVTQIGEGKVNIRATSKSDPHVHGDSKTIEVTNVPDIDEVTVSAAGGINTLYIGKTAGAVQMYASVLPNGSDQSVTWSVDDENVAIISETGRLEAKGSGVVRVTATSVSSDKTGHADITVIQQPISVIITGSTSVEIGKTTKLEASIFPESTKNKDIRWESKNDSILSVSQDGTVTGIGEGTAEIRAYCRADETVTASIRISTDVLPISVFINNPASTVMDIDETLELTASINPSNATNETVSWESSDSSIATVVTENNHGIVTAKNPGTVKITVRTWNGKTDTITLTVRQPYTLFFNPNGEKAVCDTPSWLCYSGHPIGGTLPTPTRTGYTFVGWYTAANEGAPVSSSSSFTSSSSVSIYAHWKPNTYTVNYNINANDGSVSPTFKTVTYDSTYGTLATPTRTGYRFDGWFTTANNDGPQITASTKVTITSTQTLYAHWTVYDYTYSIIYKSVNGTMLGSSSVTNKFGTTNTITPPAYTGYTTPASQNVSWDAISKTITFTYTPEDVVNATTSGTFTTSPSITYTTETKYRNRTATSVEVCVTWTLTIHGKGHTTMQNAIHFWGKCGNVSIPNTKITSWNEWKGPYAAGVNKTKSATSAWVTIPLTTTNQTTLSLSMELWQCNSSGTKLTSNTHKTGLPLTVNIPAY